MESESSFWKKQRKQILKGLKRTSAIDARSRKDNENKLMSVRCIRSGARYLFWWPGKDEGLEQVCQQNKEKWFK